MSRRPPSIGPDFNPGNAFWCTEHPLGVHDGRLECTKQRSKGRGRCHGPAIRGTDACRIHGGTTLEKARIRGKLIITAWSAVGETADGQGVEAGMAVLKMLQTAWLRAAVYGELLRRQVAIEGSDGAHELSDPENTGGSNTGLIGFRYGAAGKDGHIFAQSEEVRALVVLESAERDRVVKYAETAHKMGISDRLTNLAESWGDLVVTRIMLVLDALELTVEQEAKVPGLIQAHLGQIDVTAIGSSESP